ncbi:hypothetical protein HIM_00234 [Hirsutella minnesotensis 3608]|nr:hypothetical protein HIM_00234 [Hirsutella minnesotensis 3608]
MSRQTMRWGPEVHEDILISVFHHISFSGSDFAKIMGDLSAKGYVFSESALRKIQAQSPLCPSKSIPHPTHKKLIRAMAKPTRGWDAKAHEALLLAFMDVFKPTKAIITSVTENMKTQGYSYSYDAINQHVQKLRKNRDMGGLAKAPGSEGGTPVKKTPTKGATRQRKTPSKRGIKELSPVDDDEEVQNLKREISDDEEFEDEKPPVKKGMKRGKKEPAPFAGEGVFDNVDEI